MAASAATVPGPAAPLAPASKAVIPVPRPLRLMLVALVMSATIMQVIDATIANVALPHMQSALSAAPDTITWVLTSYIVASAISTPVTGWLGERIGRRRLLLTAVTGFTMASISCGLATSLEMMVLSRLSQGVFGAFIVPLGQALMLDIHPREKHPQALALWGLGVMVAPVLGPLIGGWLTDSFDWRWVFFINVPLGFLTFIGLFAIMPKIPNTPRRFDGIGFAMLFLSLGAFQLMLDRGPQLDWFDSTEVLLEAMVAIGAVWVFAVHTATRRDTILPSMLFRDRNLLLASLFLLLIMGMLIATSTLLPSFLQRLMGYTPYTAGLITAPRGAGMMVSMLLAGRLIRIVDPRALIFFGLSLSLGAVFTIRGFTLEMGTDRIILAGVIQGLGFGFVALPLNLLAFATLDPRRRTEAASLYSLSSSLGGSIAISSLTATMTHMQQVSHSDLAANITAQSIPALPSQILGPLAQGGSSVFLMIDAQVNRQAAMIAFLDCFYVMFWAMLAALPFVWLLRPPKKTSGAPLPVIIE